MPDGRCVLMSDQPAGDVSRRLQSLFVRRILSMTEGNAATTVLSGQMLQLRLMQMPSMAGASAAEGLMCLVIPSTRQLLAECMSHFFAASHCLYSLAKNRTDDTQYGLRNSA